MISNDRKAVVVGGSNGIGLAICKALVQRGYYIEICDCAQPEEGVLATDSYSYHYSNLLDFDEDAFESLASDQSVELLMVTAGIGRIADFQFHHTAEIEKMLTVAAGLFCRKMDGRFCRKKPDTDVRRAGRIDVAGVFCRTREARGQSRSLH